MEGGLAPLVKEVAAELGGGALLKVLKAHLFKVLNRAVFDAFMLSLYIGLYS